MAKPWPCEWRAWPPIWATASSNGLLGQQVEAEARKFAEEAIRAVGRGDVPGAQMAISQAFEFDRDIGPIADAIHLACSEIQDDGGVSTSTWNTLADAVDSPELLAVVESTRT